MPQLMPWHLKAMHRQNATAKLHETIAYCGHLNVDWAASARDFASIAIARSCNKGIAGQLSIEVIKFAA